MIQITGSKVILTDNVYRLEGYATFAETPNPSDYKVGFLFGKDYSDLSFIPMGSYEWDNANKKLTIITEITNPPIGDKYYFHPYIQPIASISKFNADGEDGEKPDIVDEPVIESQTANKSLTQPVGETITFNIIMQNPNGDATFNYDWEYRFYANEQYPESWSNISNDLPEYTTPQLTATFDNAQVRCRVYNNTGETYSQIATIGVITE